MRPRQLRVVVMGVSGAGKSTIGTALAEAMGIPFVDADDLHPSSNIAKMSAGVPLDDNDRRPWLITVGETLNAAPEGVVIACSALKRSYRDLIRSAAPSTRFILLELDAAALRKRLSARRDHFMPAALLDSQLATLEQLEPDEDGISIDASLSRQAIVAAAQDWLSRRSSPD